MRALPSVGQELEAGPLFDALRDSARLDRLEKHRPSVTFLRALGQGRDEQAHSRLIAYLLDSRRSDLATPVVRGLLEHCAEYLGDSDGGLAEPFRRTAGGDPECSAKRERWFIDVVVEARSGSERIALGIENKIDAGEGSKQIERYQDTLLQNYPRDPRAILFLTPDGREPETAGDGPQVPCVPVGYEELAGILDKALEAAHPSADQREVAENLLRHWREEIVGEDELRREVLELWRDHPQAMRLAMAYRPRLEDVKKKCVRELEQAAKLPLHVSYHPKRGVLKEIKVTPKKWWTGGLPVTVMFSQQPAGPPELRLLVKDRFIRDYERRVKELARVVNEARIGLQLDERVPRQGHWHVLVGVEPHDGILGDVWDEQTAESAVETAASWINDLAPFADDLLEPDVGPGGDGQEPP